LKKEFEIGCVGLGISSVLPNWGAMLTVALGGTLKLGSLDRTPISVIFGCLATTDPTLVVGSGSAASDLFLR
jgi:hypothetical protein